VQPHASDAAPIDFSYIVINDGQPGRHVGIAGPMIALAIGSRPGNAAAVRGVFLLLFDAFPTCVNSQLHPCVEFVKSSLTPNELLKLLRLNSTSTNVLMWRTACETFRRAEQPFELRDVTDEHMRFVWGFAAMHGLKITRSGTTVRFDPVADLNLTGFKNSSPSIGRMASPGYVWEKCFMALSCLAAGDEPFATRLRNAYASALVRLTPEDAPDDLVDHLRWILRFSREQSLVQAPISEFDRRMLVDKLMQVLTATTLPRIG
jgi:hypothetical protein